MSIMKRSLFAVIITLFVSLPAFAKSGIKVLNGDLSVIKNSNNNSYCCI